MSDDTMKSAVAECVAKCRNSPAILVCVAEYVLRLLDEFKWPRKDAEAVGRQAISELQKIGKHPD